MDVFGGMMPIPDELLPPSLQKNKKPIESLNKPNDSVGVPKKEISQINPESNGKTLLELSSNKKPESNISDQQVAETKTQSEELKPQAEEPKNERTEKPKSEINLEPIQSSIESQQPLSQPSPIEMKKNKWAPWAKRALPVFLTLILAFGISIAAVPQWRSAFNKFIAQWSPRADYMVDDPDIFQDPNCKSFYAQGDTDPFLGSRSVDDKIYDYEKPDIIKTWNNNIAYKSGSLPPGSESSVAPSDMTGAHLYKSLVTADRNSITQSERSIGSNSYVATSDTKKKYCAGDLIYTATVVKIDDPGKFTHLILNEAILDSANIEPEDNRPIKYEFVYKPLDGAPIRLTTKEGYKDFKDANKLRVSVGSHQGYVPWMKNEQGSFWNDYYKEICFKPGSVTNFRIRNSTEISEAWIGDGLGATIIESTKFSTLPTGYYAMIPLVQYGPVNTDPYEPYDPAKSRIGSYLPGAMPLRYADAVLIGNGIGNTLDHSGALIAEGEEAQQGTNANWKSLRYAYREYGKKGCMLFEPVNLGPGDEAHMYPDKGLSTEVKFNTAEQVYVASSDYGEFSTSNPAEEIIIKENLIGANEYLPGFKKHVFSGFMYGNYKDDKPRTVTIKVRTPFTSEETTQEIKIKYTAPKAEMIVEPRPFLKDTKFEEKDGNYVVNSDNIAKVTTKLYKVMDDKEVPTQVALKNYAFGLQLPGFEAGKKALVFVPSESTQNSINEYLIKLQQLKDELKKINDDLAVNPNDAKKLELANKQAEITNQTKDAKDYFDGKSKENWWEIDKMHPSYSWWKDPNNITQRIYSYNTDEFAKDDKGNNIANQKYAKAVFYLKGKDEGASKIDLKPGTTAKINNLFSDGLLPTNLTTTSAVGLKFTKNQLVTPTLKILKIKHNSIEADYKEDEDNPFMIDEKNPDEIKFEAAITLGDSNKTKQYELILPYPEYLEPAGSFGNNQDKIKRTVTWKLEKIAGEQKFQFTLKLVKNIAGKIPFDAKSVSTIVYSQEEGKTDTKTDSNSINTDIWSKISGTVFGPYDNWRIPGVTLTLENGKNELIGGVKPGDPKDVDPGKVITTNYDKDNDKAGNYNLEFNKNDLKDSEIKIAVYFYNNINNVEDSKKDPKYPNNPLLKFVYEDGSQVFFKTQNIKIIGEGSKYSEDTGIISQDIKINKGNSDPEWDMPKDATLVEQTKTFADVWTNLYPAWKNSPDFLGVELKDQITAQVEPGFKEEDRVESKTNSYFAKNKIYLNEEALTLHDKRYAFEEYHQFGHVVLEKLYGGEMKPPTLDDFVYENNKDPKIKINFSHGGYLNDFTTDSLLEGLAKVISSELFYNFNLTKNKEYVIKNSKGDALVSLLNPAAIFSDVQIIEPVLKNECDENLGSGACTGANPDIGIFDYNRNRLKNSKTEYDAIASIINSVLDHGDQSGVSKYSTNDGSNQIREYVNPITYDDKNDKGEDSKLEFHYDLQFKPDKKVDLKTILTDMSNDKINTLPGLYYYLKCKLVVGQSDYNTANINILNIVNLKVPMINALDQLFVLFGAFHDDNGNWHYDWGETIGAKIYGTELGSGASAGAGAGASAATSIMFGGNVKPIFGDIPTEDGKNMLKDMILMRRDWRE